MDTDTSVLIHNKILLIRIHNKKRPVWCNQIESRFFGDFSSWIALRGHSGLSLYLVKNDVLIPELHVDAIPDDKICFNLVASPGIEIFCIRIHIPAAHHCVKGQEIFQDQEIYIGQGILKGQEIFKVSQQCNLSAPITHDRCIEKYSAPYFKFYAYMNNVSLIHELLLVVGMKQSIFIEGLVSDMSTGLLWQFNRPSWICCFNKQHIWPCTQSKSTSCRCILIVREGHLESCHFYSKSLN